MPRSQTTSYGPQPYLLGAAWSVYANQGTRKGVVVAQIGGEILVEYFMPAGSTSLRLINTWTRREKSVSVASLNRAWRRAVNEAFWSLPTEVGLIANTQGAAHWALLVVADDGERHFFKPEAL